MTLDESIDATLTWGILASDGAMRRGGGMHNATIIERSHSAIFRPIDASLASHIRLAWRYHK